MGSLPLCSSVGPALCSALSEGLFAKDEENTIWTLGYLTRESHFCLLVNVSPLVQSGATLVRTDNCFLCPSITGGPVIRGNRLTTGGEVPLELTCRAVGYKMVDLPLQHAFQATQLIVGSKIMLGQMKTS